MQEDEEGCDMGSLGLTEDQMIRSILDYLQRFKGAKWGSSQNSITLVQPNNDNSCAACFGLKGSDLSDVKVCKPVPQCVSNGLFEEKLVI